MSAIVYLLLLYILATVCFSSSPQHVSWRKWHGLILGLIGAGHFVEWIYPLAIEDGGFLLRVTYLGFPYAVLMWSVQFANLFTRKQRRVIATVSVLPILVLDLRIGAGIYLGFAVTLLITCFVKMKKRPCHEWLEAVGWLSSVGFIYVREYVMANPLLITPFPIGKVHSLSLDNPLVDDLLLLLVSGVISVSSILRKLLASPDKKEVGLSKETSFLNHAVKNDILKISYLSRQVKDLLQKNDNHEALRNLECLEQVTDHMMKKSEHINRTAEPFVINLGNHQLTHLALSTLELFKPLVSERNIELITEFRHDAELQCDEIHLRELISNLIQNAIEAMEKMEGKARLQIVIGREDEDVLLEVIDNGIGIPKMCEKSIFNLFFTTKSGKTNFGMGLYYCRCVVEEHGGSIYMRNNLMIQGTAMVARFPKERIVRWIS